MPFPLCSEDSSPKLSRSAIMKYQEVRMMEVILKAKTEIGFGSEINFDFGRVQSEMSISKTGKAARKLRLKNEEKVEIIIRKLD